uniref:P0650D04.7 protein n=1 Tax=Oryza sativa subsp. japonica TaxID=39947 RepID=Q5H9X5_ORYSJ|nr:P0650D04.7 [Oryza sativa Japonica Group]
MAMQKELNNFTRNEVWTLVKRPRQNVIGTKWIFHNKQDEAGVMIRNKARHNNDIFVCQIYVDDIIFGYTNKSFSEEFSRMMTKRFEMSMMGELKFFLGLQIKQLKEGTFICQTRYLKDMVKKFGMENAKPIHTPMPSNSHIDLNEQGKDVDQKVYRSIIGSLVYLCASRPDIMLSVCMCARFQAAPKECHLVAVKRILRYLVHTPNLGLWYPKGARFDLIGYADADYAGCKVDRKSTSGTCQFLGRSLVSWSSKKQNPSLYPPPKQNMFRRGVVVFNFFG